MATLLLALHALYFDSFLFFHSKTASVILHKHLNYRPLTEKTLMNVDEGHCELQWDSCLRRQKKIQTKQKKHELEIDEKWAKGLNYASCNHFTSSNTFLLMALTQQPSECKQSTDFQFTDCVPVNRSLPLEVQFTDESLACSRILSCFRRQCRVL